MTEKFEMIAKTFQGLEGVLAKELIELEAEEVEVGRRMVAFKGDLKMMYRANFCCRTALRILKPIYKFKAMDADSLYEAVKDFEWDNVMKLDQTFSIDSTVYSEEFRHSKFVTYRVKDAIADFFNDKYGKRPSIRLTNADLMFNVHIAGDEVTLSLDSSGESLHKRGYRVAQTEAPINEVLAAGLIKLAGWNGDCNLVDPMCGSGTFLIEAALIGANIYPGVYRDNFGFERWNDFDAEMFDSLYNDDSNEKAFEYKIYGSDISPKAISITEANIKRASVGKYIDIKVQNLQGIQEAPEKGMIITNPPYGERIGVEDMEALYSSIGERLKKVFKGYKAWIIGYQNELFDQIGLKPSIKFPILNGALECEFREYIIFDGSYNQFRSEGGHVKDEDFKRPEKPVHKSRFDQSVPRYGDKDRKFGDRKEGGDRKFGDRDRKFGDRKEGGFGGDRKFGDRKEGGFGGDRKFGDRKEGGFGGDRKFGDRKEGGFGGDRKFGDRKEGGFGGDRKFGDRREGGFGGDRKFGDRKEGGFGGDRKFGDRKEGGFGGDRKFGDRKEGGFGGDRKFGDRKEGGFGGDRKFGDRKEGGFGGDRKFGDRKEGGFGGDRKFGDRKEGGFGGDRKFGDRREGGFGGDRKFGDRKEGGFGGDRKFGDRREGGFGGDRKFGDRKEGGFGGDRKFGDRREGGFGGDRKFGDRKEGGFGGDRKFGDRKEGGFGGDRKFGDRREGGFGGDRKFGDRKEGGFGGDRKFGDRKEGGFGGDRKFGDRKEGGFGGDRKFGDRKEGGFGGDRKFGDRKEGGFGGDRKFGDRKEGGFGGDRKFGDRKPSRFGREDSRPKNALEEKYQKPYSPEPRREGKYAGENGEKIHGDEIASRIVKYRQPRIAGAQAKPVMRKRKNNND